MRRHPSAGYRILNEARLYTNIPLDVCVHHHERVDGRGYPFGLVEHEISVHAKIAAICDTYDSLTSPRPNHQAWAPARAVEYIAVRVDTLFDRRVFKAFTRTVGIYPLGTVLRLRSSRLGVVCGQNEDEPLRPRVMTFYNVAASQAVPPQVIDLSHSEDTVVAFGGRAPVGLHRRAADGDVRAARVRAGIDFRPIEIGRETILKAGGGRKQSRRGGVASTLGACLMTDLPAA